MSSKPRPRRRLVESLRRRPDFDPDAGYTTPVRLADGSEWHLSRPWLELVPIFRRGRPVDSARVLTCGDELDGLIESIAGDEPGPAQVLKILALGAFLLERNYDLADDEFGRLFVFRPNDPASTAMLEGIMDVACGGAQRIFGGGALADPKPSAAG